MVGEQVTFALRPLSWCGERAPESDSRTISQRKLIYSEQGADDVEVQYTVHGCSTIKRISTNGKGAITYFYDDKDAIDLKKVPLSVLMESDSVTASWVSKVARGEVR